MSSKGIEAIGTALHSRYKHLAGVGSNPTPSTTSLRGVSSGVERLVFNQNVKTQKSVPALLERILMLRSFAAIECSETRKVDEFD